MNVELANKVIEAIRKNPEHHDQGSWINNSADVAEDRKPACGTKMCFAGWAAFLSAPVGTQMEGTFMYFPNGRQAHVWDYAQAQLEIDEYQSDPLFLGANNVNELEVLVNELADSPDMTSCSLWDAIRTYRETEALRRYRETH